MAGFDPLGLIYLLGNMGKNMLAGTDKAWVGSLGGTAADVASNMATAKNYKSLVDALSGVTPQPASAGIPQISGERPSDVLSPLTMASKASADGSIPALSGLNVKLDPTGKYHTAFGLSFKPETTEAGAALPIPSTAKASATPTAPMSDTGRGLMSYPFSEALRLSSRVG